MASWLLCLRKRVFTITVKRIGGISLAALVLAAVSVYLLWPILSVATWYKAHQAYRYPYLMDLFKDSFLEGHFYPRWLPELAGGYGIPTFVYYPPGFWFLGLPIALFLPIIATMKLTLLILFALAASGAFLLARHFSLTIGESAFCGVVFLTTPYVLHQLYVRGSLSELQGMLLSPWVLYTYFRLSDAARAGKSLLLSSLALAVTSAAVMVSHPFAAFWLAVGLLIIIGDEVFCAAYRKHLMAGLIAAGVMALSLSSPYWFSFIFLKDSVQYENGVGVDLERAQSFLALFNHAKWYLLNPCIYILALMGCFLLRREPHARACLIGCIVLLIIILPMANYLWAHSDLLAYTQKKVRVISALASFQLMGIIFLCRWMRVHTPSLKARYAGFTFITLASLAFIAPGVTIVGEVFDYEDFKLRAEESFSDMTHTHEFLPTGTTRKGLMQRINAYVPVLEGDAGKIMGLAPGRDDDIYARIHAPAKVTINQFKFPGWRIQIDGKEIDDASIRQDEYGRMIVDVPGNGTRQFHAWFDGPPHWLARNIAALIAFSLAIAGMYYYDRKPEAVIS